MQFETKIREVRIAQGLTQKQLAQAVGVSRVFITQVENNQKQPSVLNLIKIAKALNVIMSDLLC